MNIEWPEKNERRQVFAVGTLIGIVLWIGAELFLLPERKVARLNLLTLRPEIRWVKGGSFTIALLSSIGLFVDVGTEKLGPRLQPLLERFDRTLRDPLTWLVFALMTLTVYTSEILRLITRWTGWNTATTFRIVILGSNLFVILYITAYRVVDR